MAQSLLNLSPVPIQLSERFYGWTHWSLQLPRIALLISDLPKVRVPVSSEQRLVSVTALQEVGGKTEFRNNRHVVTVRACPAAVTASAYNRVPIAKLR